jgi:hypothetical protein
VLFLKADPRGEAAKRTALLHAAHVHQALNDVEPAGRCFSQVDRIFPRGCLDTKPALDSLPKESTGELKPGANWRFGRHPTPSCSSATSDCIAFNTSSSVPGSRRFNSAAKKLSGTQGMASN